MSAEDTVDLHLAPGDPRASLLGRAPALRHEPDGLPTHVHSTCSGRYSLAAAKREKEAKEREEKERRERAAAKKREKALRQREALEQVQQELSELM
mgnify:CR=1 FL=1